MKAEIVDIEVGVPESLLKSVIKENKEYWPFIIHVDSDHAGYIEFGTQGRGPGTKSSAKSNNSKNEFYENIRKWLYDRGANISGKHVGGTSNESQVIYAVMKKIIENGIPPQPFIRPAIHSMEEDLKEGAYSDKTMTFIAEEIIQRMIENLDRNHTLYGDWEIAKSIRYEQYDPDMKVESATGPLVGGQPIDEKVWKSDYADLKGNENRAKERQYRNLRF